MLNSTAVLCISLIAVGILFSVVRTIVNIVRAKRAGAIRTVRIAKVLEFTLCILGAVIITTLSIYFGCPAISRAKTLNDLNERGYAALAEYNGVTEEEFTAGKSEDALNNSLSYEKFCLEREINRAVSSAAQGSAWAILFIVLAVGCGASVTKDGTIFFWEEFSPHKAFARIKKSKRMKKEEIAFYDAESGEELPLSLPVTKEDTELLCDIILPEGMRPPSPPNKTDKRSKEIFIL